MDKLKVPRRSSDSTIAKLLKSVPKDGQFYQIREMGQTSAEQTARNLNNPFSEWEFGYMIGTNAIGEIVSFLYARFLKK